jgi:hypothetical protein
LVEAHERLAHNEKIAALERVAAQVAHEVKNSARRAPALCHAPEGEG